MEAFRCRHAILCVLVRTLCRERWKTFIITLQYLSSISQSVSETFYFCFLDFLDSLGKSLKASLFSEPKLSLYKKNDENVTEIPKTGLVFWNKQFEINWNFSVHGDICILTAARYFRSFWGWPVCDRCSLLTMSSVFWLFDDHQAALTKAIIILDLET